MTPVSFDHLVGAGLYAGVCLGRGRPLTAYPFQAYRREAAEPQGVGRSGRKVNNPSANEWTAIIDPHNHTAAVPMIGDTHLTAKWQPAMRCR
jgi:hypothetical protein